MLIFLLACARHEPPPPATLLPLMEADDPVIGSPTARYTLMEFSDFQCPFCQRMFPQLVELVEKTPDLRLVYKNYPLHNSCNSAVRTTMHPYACAAAKASWCANQQGAFLPVAEFLFANVTEAENLEAVAKAGKISHAELESCMQSGNVTAALKQDIQDATSVAITGTPFLLLHNGKEWKHVDSDMQSVNEALSYLK
jgi:protein-disulfide isomerase